MNNTFSRDAHYKISRLFWTTAASVYFLTRKTHTCWTCHCLPNILLWWAPVSSLVCGKWTSMLFFPALLWMGNALRMIFFLHVLMLDHQRYCNSIMDRSFHTEVPWTDRLTNYRQPIYFSICSICSSSKSCPDWGEIYIYMCVYIFIFHLIVRMVLNTFHSQSQVHVKAGISPMEDIPQSVHFLWQCWGPHITVPSKLSLGAINSASTEHLLYGVRRFDEWK